MKILVIGRGYPTEKYKLNGIFEFDQAKALAAAGHEVIFAGLDMRSVRRWRKWGHESFESHRIRVETVNIPCGRIPDSILDRIKKRALKYLFRKVVDKYGTPDVIHTHFIWVGYIAVELLGGKGIPIVHTEHFSEMNKDVLSNYYKSLGRNTYPKVDKVIAVSRFLAENISQIFGIDVDVIPNVADTSGFKYVCDKKDERLFNVISVGRLVPSKGMDLLIEAFGKAFDGDETARLFIYGEGVMMDKLSDIISKLNLDRQVNLMGSANREEIAQKMNECNIFALASERETFGLAIIEAMAAGLPVIYAGSGGPEDFIDDSNGIIVRDRSVGKLAEALIITRKNYRKYDPEYISMKVSQESGSNVIAEKLTRIYLTLVENRSHRGAV